MSTRAETIAAAIQVDSLGDRENVLTGALISALKMSASFDKEANSLAGRMYHYRLGTHCTKTVQHYLDVFGSRLDCNVAKFITDNSQAIEECCSLFKGSVDYESLVSVGILSATRYFDTYLQHGHDVDGNSVFESVPHMFMRIAAFCATQCTKHPFLRETIMRSLELSCGTSQLSDYNLFSYFYKPLATQLVCCATPIIRSAGLRDATLSSCFIIRPDLSTEEKTLEALHTELSPLLASKSGVGLDVGSYSQSKNILNFLQMVNAQVEYFNDDSLRPVSVATYIEPWHYQVQEFLTAKLPENPKRCASLFQGLCINSLFFETYLQDPESQWYLFNPKDVNLGNLYGAAFNAEYAHLVATKQYCGSVSIKSLMFAIVNAIVKTGTPYILLKEACNEHHWYEPTGSAICAANLCAEVIQEPQNCVSTCNLANICLPKCMVPKYTENGLYRDDTALRGDVPLSEKYKPAQDNRIEFVMPERIPEWDLHQKAIWNKNDFSLARLRSAVEVAVFVVNAAILGGSCPTPGVQCGQDQRSMGIGVHGLADVFAELGFDYTDNRAELLDRKIFEHMYFKAIQTSNRICALGGASPFKGWERSKLSTGRFHWEEWENVPLDIDSSAWQELRLSVMEHGTFNCQFLALMPTTGVSQLTGYTESFHPFFANYSSKVSNKEEVLRPNVTFLRQLLECDMHIVKYYGGEVNRLPPKLAERYSTFRTAFDYSPYDLACRARARAPFIDQSQSYSIFLNEGDAQSAKFIKDILLLSYRKGLKTLMYYCRVRKETDTGALTCMTCPVADNNKPNWMLRKPASGSEWVGPNGNKGDPGVNFDVQCLECQ
uniref:Ribonucleoside-diphosphate reductase n=1 Tax=Otarine gammaherpesvirus 4 TaxID=2801541 RepID=A0A889IW31_9GAMA|nr:Ribonucleotide reductase large subunit [Otarine gammaherpesvirus 4]